MIELLIVLLVAAALVLVLAYRRAIRELMGEWRKRKKVFTILKKLETAELNMLRRFILQPSIEEKKGHKLILVLQKKGLIEGEKLAEPDSPNQSWRLVRSKADYIHDFFKKK